LAFRNQEQLLRLVCHDSMEAIHNQVLLPARAELDRQYLRNGSLRRDLRILAETFLCVARFRNRSAFDVDVEGLLATHPHPAGGSGAKVTLAREQPPARIPSSSAMKVLIAGGCQVTGFPVGQENSFPHLIRARLARAGVAIDCRAIPYLAFARFSRLAAECRQWKPDTLVLQVGHYEMTPGRRIRKLVPALSRRRKRPVPGATPDRMPVRVFSRRSLEARLWLGLRSLADLLSASSLVDMAQFQRELEAFFAKVSTLDVENVIVLGPLPCADRLSMRYRLRAEPMYRELAARHGFVYMDLMDLEPPSSDDSFAPAAFFSDYYHLGAAGQQKVAGEVAVELLITCSSTEAVAS
jgi:hypothetical protein